MRASKKKRLVARGWAVGDARDFLGLSEEEAAFVELKLALAENLRQRRQKRGMTQTQLAKRLESSQSRVAKMEGGDRSVSLDLLVRSLLTVGMTRRELARVIGSSARSRAALYLPSAHGRRSSFREDRCCLEPRARALDGSPALDVHAEEDPRP
jgi:DNA-binding XRE family transcriptional regulator